MAWTDVRDRVADAIGGRQGTKRRRGKGDELWLDHHCLFHDDRHHSATFETKTGKYYCRTENRTYSLEDLAQHFGIDSHDLSGRPLQDSFVFTYRFPDGTVSHLKHRQGNGKDKKIWQTGPDGEGKPPELRAPTYGQLSGQGVVVVVEGENGVDAITQAKDHFQGLPIQAITAGSCSDLERNAQAVVMMTLLSDPRHVVLWPDNDEPGIRAMNVVRRAFDAQGWQVQVVTKQHLGTDTRGFDCVDYLREGGSLAALCAKVLVDPKTDRARKFVEQIIVTNDSQFIYPGTRQAVRIEREKVEAAILSATGQLPTAKELREVHLRLVDKSYHNPSQVAFRRVSDNQNLWWRPDTMGQCWHVNAGGIHLAPDPTGVLLALAQGSNWMTSEVKTGEYAAFDQVAKWFSLTETEQAILLGWMVCAMVGVQTPILLLKGEAGTGKSTLARLATAVIEPMVPHLDLSSRNESRDERELIRTLQRSPALVIDNLSSMNGHMEDLLCQLVTGLTRAIRSLYEETITMLRLYRAIAITSIGWDPKKGDLSDRLVVLQPKLGRGYKNEAAMLEESNELMPALRGYVFQQCVTYFQNVHGLNGHVSPFRTGIGDVLAAIGFDANLIAQEERQQKSQVLGADDAWLQFIKTMWAERIGDTIEITATALFDKMREQLRNNAPGSPIALGRWLKEMAPVFRDHGLNVKQHLTGEQRLWVFEPWSELGL